LAQDFANGIDKMNTLLKTLLVAILLTCSSVLLAETTNDSLHTDSAVIVTEESNDEGHSFAHKALMYLPNRVLDIFDIFRVRVRVGPGIGVGVRVTDAISLKASSYTSIYAGLPGPRRKPSIKSPIGIEIYNGLGLSYLTIETENYGPHYSGTEIGLDLQAALLGIAVAVDPLEILDFVTGIVGIEVVEDDL
jgi:hypothetical protein